MGINRFISSLVDYPLYFLLDNLFIHFFIDNLPRGAAYGETILASRNKNYNFLQLTLLVNRLFLNLPKIITLAVVFSQRPELILVTGFASHISDLFLPTLLSHYLRRQMQLRYSRLCMVGSTFRMLTKAY